MDQHNLQNVEDHHDLLVNIVLLRKKYQEVLRLRYWSGLSYQEISKVLGVTEVTAKVWHHRAIESLKKIFNTYEID